MYLCQNPISFPLGCQIYSSHEKEQNKNIFQLLEFLDALASLRPILESDSFTFLRLDNLRIHRD